MLSLKGRAVTVLGAVCLAVVGMVQSTAAPASADAERGGQMVIRVDGGRLWATLSEAPAGAVFDRIAEQARFTVFVHPSLRALPLSANIDDAELEDGLRRLIGTLGSVGFVLEFVKTGEEDRLAFVSVVPFGELGIPEESVAAAPELPPGQLKKLERWRARGDDHLPLGVAKKWIRAGVIPDEVIESLPPAIKEKLQRSGLQWERGSSQ